MLKREDFEKKTKVELRELAKELNIVGRWDMTKPQLIDAILETENTKNSNEFIPTKSVEDEIKNDNRLRNVEADAKNEKKSADINNIKIDMSQKEPYLKDAKVGALIAFKLDNGKVKSAKIIKKSTSKRRLKVETEYGAVYIVSYDDVLWVRTGKRWPRGVYRALKGLTNDGKERCEKD